VTAELHLPSRVIAHVRGERPGPAVILVGGLHGNEPAGVLALQRLATTLPDAAALRGEVMALAGNLAALREGARFLDTDMNRGWWPERLAEGSAPGPSEDRERRELMAHLEPVLERSEGAPIVVDLHTASGDTAPFITLGDTLRNRWFADGLPLPKVLGVEEQLAATFLEYLNNIGCITLGCEGGRHDDPVAVERLEAVAWSALARAGAVDEAALPEPDPRDVLREAADGLPGVLEVRYRQHVPSTRIYLMDQGFRSFDPVRKGQRLGAWEDGQEVVAHESGRILLPLYQAQGEDGFFIVGRVRHFWLRLSALLRRLRAERLAPLLPGVRRHPFMAGTVIVDRRIARWFTVEVFHLLGFRREVEQGQELIMSRRHFDTPDHWR